MTAPAEPLFLGVDGGGSKTLAVVVDASGRERGRGHAGGANYRAVGLAAAAAQVHGAVAAALLDADAARPCAAGWLGLAGIDAAADADALRPHLAALAGALRLSNDAELVLGALPEGNGVALIAGTGAIALGRDRHGSFARASGWGHLLGDEGSGFAIGQHALHAAVRAADERGPATRLLTDILAAWALPAPVALIEYVHARATKADIARLAPLVFTAAEMGDMVAQHIMQHGAAELAHSALTVAQRLDLPPDMPLACGGSLLTRNDAYRDLVLAQLHAVNPYTLAMVVADPAYTAACLLAHIYAKDRTDA